MHKNTTDTMTKKIKYLSISRDDIEFCFFLRTRERRPRNTWCACERAFVLAFIYFYIACTNKHKGEATARTKI